MNFKKTQLLLILIGIFFIKCVVKPNEKIFNFLESYNELEINHTDDKYGEWGGDTDVIRLYSDGANILADYKRYLGSTESPMPPKTNEAPKKWYEYKPIEIEIDSIKLNAYEINLIQSMIIELVKHKINNPNQITHSGIFNSIVSTDSSLIINDYPSIEWESFQKLKNEIKDQL